MFHLKNNHSKARPETLEAPSALTLEVISPNDKKAAKQQLISALAAAEHCRSVAEGLVCKLCCLWQLLQAPKAKLFEEVYYTHWALAVERPHPGDGHLCSSSASAT